ncbi:hypothetical protein KSS87_013426 [Heliosperma pusillum]|nr:hypothetical protein KSS87_013426 [Heliosperma pusillum]
MALQTKTGMSNILRYVERLLDRINNGTKAEDRRIAMVELQSVVAENHAAQLAFGAMGFVVVLGVLREERDDVEMVRGALETLVSSLTPLNHSKATKIEVEPSKMNADLLSREVDNISLLLSLLAEDDFYIRYYTLQVLTTLLTNSPGRLQESILAVPRGITRLMDMLMDREVIRNEALLLLTYLTREAEEIQKIVVFEGAFEKIFTIVKEEGGSDGGVVVQDCLELLNNILRNNTSNQTLLRETVGFDPVISLLKLRGAAYSFTQQKTINLLSALETINLLIASGPQFESGKDTNSLTNKTVLVQRKVMDHLLLLGVESQWTPIAIRCGFPHKSVAYLFQALRCIGDMIAQHPKNIDELASKVLGEEPQVEPALNSILRIILRTSSIPEFLAADYVFKSFCEKNPDGQMMLASTLIPQPSSVTHLPFEEDVNMSFGSMLLHGLTVSENDGDLEICARAASVLSHLLKDNYQCKERGGGGGMLLHCALHILIYVPCPLFGVLCVMVLKIELPTPVQALGAPEPLLHRMVKYLAIASSMNNKDEKRNGKDVFYVEQMILKLLIVWLVECPSAVQCFLDARPHLTYLVELLLNESVEVCTRGLAAVLLGECTLYNKSVESGKDAFGVVDAISQKAGLTSYFLKFDEMQKSILFSSRKPTELRKPLTRSTGASMVDIENDHNDSNDKLNEVHPVLASVFDMGFVTLVSSLESNIREQFVEVYSKPKTKVAVVPAELERRRDESDSDYIVRLKSFVDKQCSEIQDLLGRNASLAEDLTKSGVTPEQRTTVPHERVQVDSLRRDLQEISQRLEMVKSEKTKVESEAVMYRNLAGKMEADLKSLSDAYNSLEQANFQLEKEVKSLRSGGSTSYPDIEAIKEEAREEAQKESEGELSDLLVCLGQEQTKVERLSARLLELGQDVDKLLEGIGDDAGVPEDDDEDEDE